jgi:hypothetical protein
MSKVWKVTAKMSFCSGKVPKGLSVEIVSANKPGSKEIRVAYEEKLGISLPGGANFISPTDISQI